MGYDDQDQALARQMLCFQTQMRAREICTHAPSKHMEYRCSRERKREGVLPAAQRFQQEHPHGLSGVQRPPPLHQRHARQPPAAPAQQHLRAAPPLSLHSMAHLLALLCGWTAALTWFCQAARVVVPTVLCAMRSIRPKTLGRTGSVAVRHHRCWSRFSARAGSRRTCGLQGHGGHARARGSE
jgi:hypothetical protein